MTNNKKWTGGGGIRKRGGEIENRFLILLIEMDGWIDERNSHLKLKTTTTTALPLLLLLNKMEALCRLAGVRSKESCCACKHGKRGHGEIWQVGSYFLAIALSHSHSR